MLFKFLLSFAASLFCLCLQYKELRAIQQSGYKLNLALRQEQPLKVVTEHLFSIFCCLIFLALRNVNLRLALGISAGMFFVFASLTGVDILSQRTKLKFTKRAVRIILLDVALTVMLVVLFALMLKDISDNVFALMLLCFLGRAVASMAFFILLPIDIAINNRFIKKAHGIFMRSGALKIAVTGSFGKTSCKNILGAILKTKYKVSISEGNYNTPLGMSLTAQKIKGDEDIIILEFGARHQGDIAELCNIVGPAVGIITGVAKQHLATFGSMENVYTAKKELVDYLSRRSGESICVFNCDNAGAKRMFDESAIEHKLAVGKDVCNDIYFENVTVTESGTEFDAVSQDFGKLHLATRLLGRHNVTNILLCTALALHLGITAEQIQTAVGNLEPIPHRLELINGANGIRIIDDSYNCNLEGAYSALEVLSAFRGRKVVYEQGVVELGAMSAEVNVALARRLAGIADVVITSGLNKDYIVEGLLQAGFPKEKIYVFKSFADAQSALSNILMSGDIFLIQNDLP